MSGKIRRKSDIENKEEEMTVISWNDEMARNEMFHLCDSNLKWRKERRQYSINNQW